MQVRVQVMQVVHVQVRKVHRKSRRCTCRLYEGAPACHAVVRAGYEGEPASHADARAYMSRSYTCRSLNSGPSGLGTQ